MKREKVYVNLNTKFGQVFIDQEKKFQDQINVFKDEKWSECSAFTI